MKKTCSTLAACVWLLAANAFAGSVELDKIVVTPYRYAEDIARIPSSVTVLTSQDIENSNAQNILDVLRPVPGLIVRDFYGSANKATADLRGFGEFAMSNTLVMVDGRRANEIDLSGVDWTQIPLETVERIEVTRGGMGGVLYGDNATGGVINIITKKGEGKPSFELDSYGGSYSTSKESLQVSGKEKNTSYFGRFSNAYSRGYRKNSGYTLIDYGAKAIQKFTDTCSVTLSASYHDDEFGLPGALRESQLGNSRRATLFPDDKVGQKDWYVQLGAENEFSDSLAARADISFRQRNIDDNLLTSKNIDTRDIDTFGFSPSLIYKADVLGAQHKLIGGVDVYRCGSRIDALSFYGLNYYDNGKTRQTDIDKFSNGYYLQDEVQVKDKLSLLYGYRYEQARYSFDSNPMPGPWTSDLFWIPTVVDSKVKVNEKAYNAGVNYLYAEGSKAFFLYSRGFRLPATDEFYSIFATPPVNVNLKPQDSLDVELGVKHRFCPSFEASATLFDLRIKNELFFDPLTFENKNYDKTEHRGMELAMELKYKELFSVTPSYTFTEAFFKGGTYHGNQIPLVPRHKVSLGAAVSLPKACSLNILGTFTGPRYFINDQAHNYPKLDGFITVDAKLSWRPSKFCGLFFGANNLFDEDYSEIGAISTAYNERGFYPSPGRNFIAGVDLSF